VLVIEDDEATRAFVAAALGDEGYTVVCGDNADDGERLARDVTPALILLDLLTPEGGSMRFLERRRANNGLRGIPVVIMTAASDDVRQRVRGLADGVLLKPFELEDLLRAARRFCAS
jgi:DNA-binding response OmpR family regulator